MNVNCPHCSGGLVWEADTAEMVVSCPYCSQSFEMPTAPPTAKAMPPVRSSIPQAVQVAPQMVQQQQPMIQTHRPSSGSGRMVRPPKSEFLGAVLSFLWPGLGQVYIGDALLGAFMMFLAPVLILGVSLFSLGIGLVFFPILWVFAVIHAYMAAGAKNRRRGWR
jgi:hypothetical protein